MPPKFTPEQLGAKEAEIRDYVEANAPTLSEEEIDHIAMCLFHLWRWYTEDFPVGDCLRAVIANNFDKAVATADDINRKNLIFYVWYTHNELPWNWRSK